MKMTYLLLVFLLTSSFSYFEEPSTEIDLTVLIGTWKLDMSPQDTTDANFAMMKVTDIIDNSFKGEFYREGVKIRNAQINTQLGIIYGALISGDGSGEYNTTFYHQNGKLYGSTHAVDRNFLSVWTATKLRNAE